MSEQARQLLEDFSFISAREYLNLYPEAGSGHTSKAFCLPYRVIKSCFCAGEIGQIIIPPAKNGRSYALTESFNYQHGAEMQATMLASALMHTANSESVKVLDEAAPLYPIWSMGNLWHWFFDSVPRICVLETEGYKGQYIVNMSSRVVQEGLELMGVTPERIVDCANPHFVKRAVVPPDIPYEALLENKRLLRSMRERMLEASGLAQGEKHCFIRRIGTRKLLNEEELLETLRPYDFQILVPEEHSLRSQIHFMSNSTLTLSPHGANTALAFFQKNKSVLMEFFGYDYIHNFCNLAAIQTLKLLYIPVTETVLSFDSQSQPHPDGHRSYRIDVSLVASILDNLRAGSYQL